MSERKQIVLKASENKNQSISEENRFEKAP